MTKGWNYVVNRYVTAWNYIVDILTKGWSVVHEYWSMAISKLSSFFAPLWNTILDGWNWLAAMINSTLTVITDAWETFFNFYSGLWNAAKEGPQAFSDWQSIVSKHLHFWLNM